MASLDPHEASQAPSNGPSNGPHDIAPAPCDIPASSADTIVFKDVLSGPATLVAEVSTKLGDLTLKKNRLLSEGFYERYSLPASRVASHESPETPFTDSPAQAPTTYSGSSSPVAAPLKRTGTEDLPPLDTNAAGRPSASYLAAAADPETRLLQSRSDSSGPAEPTGASSAPSSSPEMTYVGSPSGPNARFELGSSSGNATPTISHESSSYLDSPTISAFPSADRDDPYARKLRAPQTINPNEIAPRFVFSKKRGLRSTASLKSLGTSSSSSRKEKSSPSLKLVLGGNHDADSHSSNSSVSSSSGGLHKSHGSMSELKRFFKPSRKQNKQPHAAVHAASPLAKSESSADLNKMPFMEEGFKKYGKLGRVLGSGAGGSVRLMKRSTDGTVFAVKEFRARHANESEREYGKKVTAEFCIGSTLHHPNVIETLDIIQDEGRYYEVMEYCPYDFFAVVMSGKMSAPEIGCCFKQILSGVQYLHEMGLAHRDLKLDNCVVTDQGIVKLIDFGSSSVFRYPFEADIVMARGVVGSDPYLAPEVLSKKEYDPRATDIWSVAIIYCCMSLRRFPWKAPHNNDNSFRLFASTPDSEKTLRRRHTGMSSNSPPGGDNTANDIMSVLNGTTKNEAKTDGSKSDKSDVESKADRSDTNVSQTSTSTPATATPSAGSALRGPSIPPSQSALEGPPLPHIIKGPWRLLRLLSQDARDVIGHMLKIDPKKRATMEDVWNDKWIQSLPCCTISRTGELIKSTDHEHTLVAPEEAHLEAYKK